MRYTTHEVVAVELPDLKQRGAWVLCSQWWGEAGTFERMTG